jgi:tRNA pseudouridine38-40 synthase
MAPEDRAGAEEGPARQRFLLTLAYDGHAFHGWQRQLPPDRPPLRTVQGELEATLKTVLKQPIRTLGASRTDARVHATGQRVQFDATTRIPPERLGKAINDRLPDDMELRQLQVVPDNFDVIGGVVSKQYRYRIFNADHRPLAIRHMVYHCWYDLDVERMKAAAQRLVGTYDVAGFAAAGHGRQNTARTIHRLEVIPNAPEIQLFFEGSGFLWHQVRIMAGTLVEVGRGKFAIEHMDRIRETADRREAGPTLPPEGLSLEWIQYPQKAFLPDEPTPTHAEEHRARNTPNTPTPSTQHPDTPGAKDQP